jgi:hypothetical protein
MSQKGMEACGDVGILARVEYLHMMNTGASCDWDRDEQASKQVAVLTTVLQNWDDRTYSPEYDNTVKRLIQIALTEKRCWK